MKKIALAHDHLFQTGGAERVFSVLASLDKSAPIFTIINDYQASKDLFSQERINTSALQKIPGSLALFKYFLPLMPRIWEQTDLSDYDLVLSSSSAFVKGLKKGKNTKHVCYCHAPTRYLWDDKEEYISGLLFGRFLKFFLPYLLNRLQTWDFKKAQEVDYFIANSKFIADKILKHYQRQSIVIHPSLRVKDFHIADEIGDYFLIVTRLRPYKKVDLAIRAFNNLKLPLKIVGAGSELRKLKKMASSNIEFLGEISNQERNYYLSHCRAFLYPQIEDFGISALEAMASGRPVIAYAQGGALETVIDGVTGTFFHHQNWASLTHAILRFREQNFDPLIIREHAKNFDETIFLENIKHFLNSL